MLALMQVPENFYNIASAYYFGICTVKVLAGSGGVQILSCVFASGVLQGGPLATRPPGGVALTMAWFAETACTLAEDPPLAGRQSSEPRCR